MIKNVHHNPTKFSIDTNKFYRYEKHLAELEGQLLDGNIYQVWSAFSAFKNNSILFSICFFGIKKNCVEQLFDDKLNAVSKNSALANEFFVNLKLIYEEIEPILGDNSTVETRQR